MKGSRVKRGMTYQAACRKAAAVVLASELYRTERCCNLSVWLAADIKHSSRRAKSMYFISGFFWDVVNGIPKTQNTPKTQQQKCINAQQSHKHLLHCMTQAKTAAQGKALGCTSGCRLPYVQYCSSAHSQLKAASTSETAETVYTLSARCLHSVYTLLLTATITEIWRP